MARWLGVLTTLAENRFDSQHAQGVSQPSNSKGSHIALLSFVGAWHECGAQTNMQAQCQHVQKFKNKYGYRKRKLGK